MRKSRYDDEVFFEKYGQMARSRLGLSGAGEWETLEPLLPDFAGKAGAGPGVRLRLALHLRGGAWGGGRHRRGPVGKDAGRGPGEDHSSLR